MGTDTKNAEFRSDPLVCIGCGNILSEIALEHGLYGFGHDGRCCACYDKRQNAIGWLVPPPKDV